MANRIQIRSRFLRVLSVFVPVLLLPAVHAADDAPAKRVGFVLGGTFEAPEIARKPEGAEKTLLVPSYEWDYGVRSFTRESWAERGFTWEQFSEIATRVADKIVEEVEPRLVRDERGIIEYAVLSKKDPFLTSVLVSEKLHDKFKDTLGDQIHIVLIDRHMIYLFPAIGTKIEDYGPALVDEFRNAIFPVSLEVFQLDDKGFRVIGELNRDS